MLETLAISAEAYQYLVVQRGALDDMRGDPRLWCIKYCEVLRSEFKSIEPYLPRFCDGILDIGSGLGGIDVLINEHYGGDVSVTLLDGIADPPTMVRHATTFNHMGVARDFLRMNGVEKMTYIDANNPHRFAIRDYDLIVSFKSWCFHTPPEKYLQLVQEASHRGTRIIVDMRGGAACNRGEGKRADEDADRRYEYMRTMTGAFKHLGMIHYGLKFETHYFEVQ